METARKNKTNFDSKKHIRFDHHSKDLNDLPPWTSIWIQGNDTKMWDEEATVLEQVRLRT